MKDWGWVNRESGNMLALMLDLDADFSPGSEHHRWFRAIKLRHYALYEGPFRKQALPYAQIVCALLEKDYYQELAGLLGSGSPIGYASVHYVLLTPARLTLLRAWGDAGTADSDRAIIAQLLERGIGIGDWAIQDFDFGNEWVRDQGTASFRAYLGC